MKTQLQRPTGAFIGASWAALFVGAITFLVGLWNARMQLNEKGYYLTILMFGLFAAVSLQKSVRDRMEGIAVTGIYYGLCWFALLLSILLLAIGLWTPSFRAARRGSMPCRSCSACSLPWRCRRTCVTWPCSAQISPPPIPSLATESAICRPSHA